MSNWKNRLMKRTLAMVLSGAVILSGVPVSGASTAYAAETDTRGGVFRGTF